jgi:hypothetical protein
MNKKSLNFSTNLCAIEFVKFSLSVFNSTVFNVEIELNRRKKKIRKKYHLSIVETSYKQNLRIFCVFFV